MSLYSHKEHFIYNDNEIGLTTNDFLKWAYNSLSNDMQLDMLAQYVVTQAIQHNTEKISVKSATYLNSHDANHPEHITYDIVSLNNSDISIFGLYKVLTKDENLFNLSLWDFFVLPTDKLKKQKYKLTLSSLMALEPIHCSYKDLSVAINEVQGR